jgi:hypothetical protein
MDVTQQFNPADALRLVERLMARIPPGQTYYQEPLPCDVDRETTGLCDWFTRASARERRVFSSSLERRHADLLLVFSERMASLGIRESSVPRLQNGLTAISMLRLETIDFREALLVLALHRHSALKLGADPKTLFLEAAGFAMPKVAEQLNAFAQREQTPIESMGFRESISADGFIYERTW